MMKLSRLGSRKSALESFVFARMGLQNSRLSGITGEKCAHLTIHAVIMLSQMLDTHNQSGLRRKVGKALQAMMCSTICR